MFGRKKLSKTTFDKKEDWPREAALEYKIPIGTLACPACSTVSSGAIEPICSWCERSYWEDLPTTKKIEQLEKTVRVLKERNEELKTRIRVLKRKIEENK